MVKPNPKWSKKTWVLINWTSINAGFATNFWIWTASRLRATTSVKNFFARNASRFGYRKTRIDALSAGNNTNRRRKSTTNWNRRLRKFSCNAAFVARRSIMLILLSIGLFVLGWTTPALKQAVGWTRICYPRMTCESIFSMIASLRSLPAKTVNCFQAFLKSTTVSLHSNKH